MFVCCTWALWRGGPVERYGATVIVVSWILSYVVDTHDGQPGPAIFTIDVVTMLLFVHLALKSRRVWTLIAAACMVDTVGAHIGAMAFHFDGFSYITITGIFGGWGMVFSLAGGMIARMKHPAAAAH